MKNTSGLRDGFVARGPYLFTRNPQYLGDILMFTGVSIAANSEIVLVTHAFTSLVFLLAPMAEEPWLKEQYGETYTSYRRDVPRFL
jgi:protein-S-isoprenylcysteine O-methyltransferase Ste14